MEHITGKRPPPERPLRVEVRDDDHRGAPLGPERARGASFDPESREQAGVAREFIERLAENGKKGKT